MKLSLLFLLALSCFTTYSQTYQFKQGLAAGQCHRYGREAIIADQLAWQRLTGALKKPMAGDVLMTNSEGKQITWKTVTADSTGRFRGDALANGYLYLTYEADRKQAMLLNISGDAMCYVNGAPRGGDIYGDGWMNLPVQIKKGLNEIIVRCTGSARWQGVSARLSLPEKTAMISTDDATLPHVVVGQTADALLGAVVVINTTAKPLTGLTLTATLEGQTLSSDVPVIAAMTLRKVPFRINASGVKTKQTYTCALQLRQKGKLLDEKNISIDAVESHDHHSYTFVSNIDGSVQYYSVAPQMSTGNGQPAMFLSVHGAGVQAIGQARAYKPKDWGVLVAPTNRRPRGFNWEDWGRLDALEVFELARKKFNPDPQKIYLTGHSMGGHGTWYLGATYPGKWAAIAPCAGYPTLTGYGSADGKIPESGATEVEKLLLRAGNASNVIELARNYRSLGVYIHHGDSDKVVPVTYAQQMRKVLGEFHKDFSYYEYPGGSHWFGNESVDWLPIFDYFRWHHIQPDSAVHVIDFTTANPAISSQYRWASVLQQQRALEFSRLQLKRDRKRKTITGTTANVSILGLSFGDFSKGDTITIIIDQEKPVKYVVTAPEDNLYLHKDRQWQRGEKPSVSHKGVDRNGTFKEAFNHRMIFVYGTTGDQNENAWAYNKARYDAEIWYYRGNGAVDMVADKDFNADIYKDRGVVLYGNATTNAAWKKLLGNCPIQVKRGSVKAGAQQFEGNNLGVYFTWPRAGSNIASVAVVSGTGLQGMRTAEANQYFAAGSGFPDYMIFSTEMLRNGAAGVKLAGFYGNDWSLENGTSATNK
ncbi:prolyl oligopeptidase family serine peptidase [Fulvivirgaceae bacterium PWU4]|uniref:Prolyl oligopeptidase family serine peptidase n=1 Tax=Chryseosolibacter histidini TaxID=2782349 RepID=A0AAP2DHG5_9BACT|nr:alpha/beta hydrolase-fold protein [Chryseosolibacter histidini]MBT1695674.1 prolyl oligopeptidase family serine peptidase [Chryseosolibacter histidini]